FFRSPLTGESGDPFGQGRQFLGPAFELGQGTKGRSVTALVLNTHLRYARGTGIGAVGAAGAGGTAGGGGAVQEPEEEVGVQPFVGRAQLVTGKVSKACVGQGRAAYVGGAPRPGCR